MTSQSTTSGKTPQSEQHAKHHQETMRITINNEYCATEETPPLYWLTLYHTQPTPYYSQGWKVLE